MREKVLPPLPGQEEIAAAAHGHEILQTFQAQRPSRRRYGQHAGASSVAENRIGFVLQGLHARIQYPDLLQELELPLDVGVVTHKHQTGISCWT